MLDLPRHLDERTIRPAASPADGGYVLYWARTALRAHENPALDVACTAASALGLPVFVLQLLSERYPYASDRHHRFILDGARDFAAELAARGIGAAFHLEREGHRGPHLRTLAEGAALVVTEHMPVAPLAGWTGALAAAVAAPVWRVDTACVVPMPLVPRAYDRAFAYRDATAALRRERLARPWRDAPAPGPAFVPALPFEPVALATADLGALIAQCRIDHAVGPVPAMRGGSAAGYARWAAWVDDRGLARYAARRNDPLQPDGVSRMSPWLHYGMVSPFRLAREAAAHGGDGADKWLDELLVWRELAYAFCHHRPDHATVGAVPAWARETFARHTRDARDGYDRETLARGLTGDDFWNAMQQSLLAHGELHNNVRMTWGKALVGWHDDADAALAALIDLNHRFALDGRDPASYGGLLWCLGQFDRPFTPPTRVFGTIRRRDTREQARRIDVAAYARLVGRPPVTHPPRIAVIGAGLAGLACARTLADHHLPVTVFEKSRAPSGRCATRHDGPFRFDHGAQYFTQRDPRMTRHVHAWAARGLVAPWRGALAARTGGAWRRVDDTEPRWVGVPGMRAVGEHLARGLDVRYETTVAALRRRGDGWHLAIATGDGPRVESERFDVVLLAVPAPQAATLLGDVAPAAAAVAAAVPMTPTIAALVVLEDPPPLAWDAAFVNDDPVLAWIARDRSKPGRPLHESWVLHATPSWSAAHLDDEPTTLVAPMFEAFASVAGGVPRVVHAVAHRWRYAAPASDAPRPAGDAHFDAAVGVGLAGDWCAGGRVEGALLSGFALAGRVLMAVHETAVPV